MMILLMMIISLCFVATHRTAIRDRDFFPVNKLSVSHLTTHNFQSLSFVGACRHDDAAGLAWHCEHGRVLLFVGAAGPVR